MKKIKTLTDIDADTLEGARVLVRIDANVPIEDGKIASDFRIRAVLPTLEFLKNAGARTIVVSHISKSNGGTLMPVLEYLKKKEFAARFVPDAFTEKGRAEIKGMENGDMLVLENVRNYSGEKQNDAHLAESLASIADVFVNDAFSVSHRVHASVVGVARLLPSYAGFLFAREIEELSRAFQPKRPFVFLLGGAKAETKVPFIRSFLNAADTVFVGGAIANSFFREKGLEIGRSAVSPEHLDIHDLIRNDKLILPKDVTVTGPDGESVKKPGALSAGDTIVDAGPETVEMLGDIVQKAKFVVWNGPIGNYESGFGAQTRKLADAVADSKAYSIVGGGDTILAAEKDISKFDFVSTGGGAMIQFIAEKTLPGIEALEG